MAIIDFVGVPIPIDLPEFRNDATLLKKIKQLESLIEIQYDMYDAQDALIALRNCLNNEKQQKLAGLLNCCYPWTISESILSYIVILYAKEFRQSEGRTSLKSQANEIFKNDIDKHVYTMDLRDKFYAHHEVEANRHQLFYYPNVPARGRVRLVRPGQTTRTPMSMYADLEKIEFCVSKVKEHLETRIDGLCTSVENNLTDEQLKILIDIPKEELMNNHWQESSVNKKPPFSKRKTYRDRDGHR
ncbi:MAG: hypothetical protein J7K15_00065 [Deltaproteobacteria bacterium]|nr:hypothetical protein [Deltaproteobacteria bacterium]